MFYWGSSFGFLPNKDHVAALLALDGLIIQSIRNIPLTKEIFKSAVHDDKSTTIMIARHAAWRKALDCAQMFMHLRWYVVATLKASFMTIRWNKTAHAIALAMTTGITLHLHGTRHLRRSS
jgi:hypothetical protein